MNLKLLGACSALSLLMFADADAMGFGRRADKANAAGLGHNVASVKAYGVAKATKKAYVKENEGAAGVSTKELIKAAKENGIDFKTGTVDDKDSAAEADLGKKFEELDGKNKALVEEIDAKNREIEGVCGELGQLIEDKTFVSLSDEEVRVVLDPAEVSFGDKKFEFGLLFHGLRGGGDGTPYISCTDEDFDLEKAKSLWSKLCDLRKDLEVKLAESGSIEEEWKKLEIERQVLELEAEIKAAGEARGQAANGGDSDQDSDQSSSKTDGEGSDVDLDAKNNLM